MRVFPGIARLDGELIAVCPHAFGCTSTKRLATATLNRVDILIIENANWNFSFFETKFKTFTENLTAPLPPFLSSKEVYSIDGLQGPDGGLGRCACRSLQHHSEW